MRWSRWLGALREILEFVPSSNYLRRLVESRRCYIGGGQGFWLACNPSIVPVVA